jgi:gluconate kinase
MPPSLLASQFEDLELPTPEEAVIEIEANQAVEAQVDRIARLLGKAPRIDRPAGT